MTTFVPTTHTTTDDTTAPPTRMAPGDGNCACCNTPWTVGRTIVWDDHHGGYVLPGHGRISRPAPDYRPI